MSEQHLVLRKHMCVLQQLRDPFRVRNVAREEQADRLHIGERGLVRRCNSFLFGCEAVQGISDCCLVDIFVCIAPGSLDTSLSHAAGLSDIAVCHA